MIQKSSQSFHLNPYQPNAPLPPSSQRETDSGNLSQLLSSL